VATLLDPQGAEPDALRRSGNFDGARVLEIGSGEGRMIFRIAHGTALAVGADPDAANVATATGRCPADLRSTVTFVQTDAMALPFQDHSFDIAVFGWSL
jgi:ubiquinone/menaquinone biosynthesis C-methylase UbiE